MTRFGELRSAPIGRITATRKIQRVGDSNPFLTVEIGEPVQFEDDESWYCPYQIRGTDWDRSFAAVGVDAVQALQLAFHMIGAELYAINRDCGGILRWCDGEDLGFPQPKP